LIASCDPDARIAVSQSPSAGVGIFQHQKIFHVCSKAKLFGFSDGFRSHRSGRQRLCLCQSVRCPGSPIVIIDIVTRQFCHVTVLAGMLADRCAPSRQHRTSSGRRISAPRESGRNWCTARSSARTRRGLRQCAEPPCATGIWDNEAAPPREVIRSGLVYLSKQAPCGIKREHSRMPTAAP
jgi:hypothetical protein